MIQPPYWPQYRLAAVYQRMGGNQYVYLLDRTSQLEAWQVMYRNHGPGAITTVMVVDDDTFEEMEPLFKAQARFIEGD